jgi:hyperosmotically inducible periplasmic protein
VNLKKRYFTAAALLGMSLLIAPIMVAEAIPQESQQPAADNTKTNASASPTADQQKMNPSDRAMTQKIRMAIHNDKSLSTYAHNVKIIAQDGKVTLKGPVRSEDEKSNIAMKAAAVAGDGNVDDQLTIAPPKQ